MPRAAPTGLPGAIVSTASQHLIQLELRPGDVLPASLFDLQGKTIRFTPGPGGYLTTALPITWESDYGNLIVGQPSAAVSTPGFTFPFSGINWSTFQVGLNGNITFGATQTAFYDPARDRFLKFRTYASSMLNAARIIAPLFHKYSISDFDVLGYNQRFVKQLANRVVVTWRVSEPYNDVFDFISAPQQNLFQAVLYSSGMIDFSYQQISVSDGIVGVFPLVGAGAFQSLDLSAQTGAQPTRKTIWESFYHKDIPVETELAAAVIAGLGDRFDLLTFYTDFRLDRQETNAVSSGAIGTAVSGVIPSFRSPQEYGSAGRLQCLQHALWIGTPICAESGSDLRGEYTGYNRQLSLVSHELGHRWLTHRYARIGTSIVAIGDSAPHWLYGMHTPVRFPWLQSNEASIMNGNVWEPAGGDLYTFRTQPFFQASGYCDLDLYLMGMLPAEECGSWFVLANPTFVGFIGAFPVYSGARTDITLDDVISYNGPRLPVFEESQREFNLGVVGIVEPGATASTELLTRLNGIRSTFVTYWHHTTGGVSTMNTSPIDCRDVDGNLTVDTLDLIALLTVFGQSLPVAAPVDLNGDGAVDTLDLVLLLQHYGQPC